MFLKRCKISIKKLFLQIIFIRASKKYLNLQKNSISQREKNTFSEKFILLRKKFILLQENTV